MHGGKEEGCSRIKDGNGKLTLGEDEARMCYISGVQWGNYFGEEPFRRAEVKVRVGKLKKGKACK